MFLLRHAMPSNRKSADGIEDAVLPAHLECREVSARVNNIEVNAIHKHNVKTTCHETNPLHARLKNNDVQTDELEQYLYAFPWKL